MEEKSRWNSAVISALIVGLVIGFVAGATWYKGKGKLPKENTQTKEAVSEKKMVVEGDNPASPVAESVVVEDQSAGETVAVKTVVAREPLWVAVRENKDGALGNILGARRVEAGESTDVSVELLRPTMSGATYHVVLYRDDAVPSFNYKEDILIEDVRGTFQAK